MTFIVQLVGEQYLPNVLPVRHYHPDYVLLVYSKRTRSHFERLQHFLQSETNVMGVETDAFNIAIITEQIEQALQTYQERWKDQTGKTTLLFNLTGGTKAMILGAQQLASHYQAPICYLQSEGIQSVIYSYEWNMNRLRQKERETLPSYLNLREMLNLTLGKEGVVWKENGPSPEEGGLFERAIADVLYRDPDYEVMCGVKFYDNIEIDVVIRYQNQLGILEAKIDKKAGKLEGIHQLGTAVRPLGTYTKQFFAINNNDSEGSQKIVREVSRIIIIPLLEYKRGATSLTDGDAAILTAKVAQSFKE
ncbi:Card1-like endonuclease domain-containing protein [Tengunoibacter tsumagoiensis]|uniref:Card1 CARF domain-containing protein n=1 Tax=Tengunoibacter tsumagoiensis TaxID=2014871 RepID=A0A402A9N7_9CHLR|nr:DUF1887 family CARF protein [Tengunoibacter tsumagoiensis]GCE15839.1 hypothetical protein KTT_56980 [Tengunoibacter tsumagoiensis]